MAKKTKLNPKGAGRKKGYRKPPELKKEPTVVMRIPESKVPAVKKLLGAKK